MGGPAGEPVAGIVVHNVSMVFHVHVAKIHLSRLIEKALAGEEVIIAKAGHPVVKLVRISDGKRRKVLGSAAGQVKFKKGWDAPLIFR